MININTDYTDISYVYHYLISYRPWIVVNKTAVQWVQTEIICENCFIDPYHSNCYALVISQTLAIKAV